MLLDSVHSYGLILSYAVALLLQQKRNSQCLQGRCVAMFFTTGPGNPTTYQSADVFS